MTLPAHPDSRTAEPRHQLKCSHTCKYTKNNTRNCVLLHMCSANLRHHQPIHWPMQ